MHDDLEALADLEFVRAIERISRETNEKLTRTRAGMPRGGPIEAATLGIELDQAEEACRTYANIWTELVETKNGGHLTRDDVNFIMRKVQAVAEARKGSLRDGPSGHPHLASASGQIVMRIDEIIASVNRDLEIRFRRQQAFRKQGTVNRNERVATTKELPAVRASSSNTPELETAKHVSSSSISANRTIFVIHGRDERLRSGMFDFLRSLDLKPLEWIEAIRLTSKATPYIGEVLDAAFSNAQAVVALFTPDDEARLREGLRGEAEPPHETQLTPQARPNVLFEAGMAMAHHPERTVLVQVGELRPFSDVAGRHMIRMDNSIEKRQDLAQRLETAGCPVNLKGKDWHTKGDFTPPFTPPVPTSTAPSPARASTIRTVSQLSVEFEEGWYDLRGPNPAYTQVTMLFYLQLGIVNRQDRNTTVTFRDLSVPGQRGIVVSRVRFFPQQKPVVHLVKALDIAAGQTLPAILEIEATIPNRGLEVWDKTVIVEILLKETFGGDLQPLVLDIPLKR